MKKGTEAFAIGAAVVTALFGTALPAGAEELCGIVVAYGELPVPGFPITGEFPPPEPQRVYGLGVAQDAVQELNDGLPFESVSGGPLDSDLVESVAACAETDVPLPSP